MTISTTTRLVTATGNGVTVSFTIPFYWILDSHIIVTRITIAGGARLLLVQGTDYTLTGAGVLIGGQVTTIGALSPLSALYQIEVARTVPVVQLDDYVSHNTFPAETMEKDLDYLTMIDQQFNDRLAILESGGASSGAITMSNLGTGVGVYSTKVGADYRLKSMKQGAGMTITDDGAGNIVFANSGTPFAYPGNKYQFLRGDGIFSNVFGPNNAALGMPTFQANLSWYPLLMQAVGAAANEGIYGFGVSNQSLSLSAFNDAGAPAAFPAGTGWRMNRSGTSFTYMEFPPRVVMGGGADDGATALQITGTAKMTVPLGIAYGGTGQATQAAAIDALTAVSAATTGWVLTKDGTGHASFQASGAAGAPLGASYVLIANDGTLTADRALAAEATVLSITDGGANSNVTVGVAANGITNAKLAQMPTLTIKGNNTGGTANAIDLTVAQVNAMLGTGPLLVLNPAYAATVTIDLTGQSNYPQVIVNVGTLTGPITFDITNGTDGQMIRVRFTQDGTGSRILTAGSHLRGSTDTPIPALTTTAGKMDRLAFEWHAGPTKADLVAYNKGY